MSAVAPETALADELRRLFAGNPKAVPRYWRADNGCTGYTPIRLRCPTCPPGPSPWKVHAESEADAAGAAALRASTGSDGVATGDGVTRAAKRRKDEVLDAHNATDDPSFWDAHVTGRKGRRDFYMGVYPIVPGADPDAPPTVRFLANDLDDKTGDGLYKPHARLAALADAARALGVAHAYVGNTSRGGRGRHARLCVDPATPAWLAQAIGRQWLVRAGIAPAPQEGTDAWRAWLERFGPDPEAGVETFPKQDGKRSRLGNLIGLPCSLPLMTEGRAALLDPTTHEVVTDLGRSLELLRAVRPLTAVEVRSLASALGIDPDATPATRRERASAPQTRVGERRERVNPAHVLAGVPEGGRNETLFRYAASLRRRGAAQVEAVELVRVAAAACEPPWEGESPDELVARVWETYDGAPGEIDETALRAARAAAERAATAAEEGRRGAPLEDEARRAFAVVRRADPASYAELRYRLKGHTDLREFDRLVKITSDEEGLGQGATQDRPAERLRSLALEHAEFARSPDGVVWLRARSAPREVMPLRSREARAWLRRIYRGAQGHGLGNSAVEEALEELAAEQVPSSELALRATRRTGDVYVDLGDADWRCVRVNAAGWVTVPHPDTVWFRRSAGLALPEPTRPANRAEALRVLNEWCGLLRLADPSARALTLGWCLAVLGAVPRYPLLVFLGEEDGGKTSNAHALVSITDPSPLTEGRTMPRDLEALAVALRHSYVLFLDNVSHISGDMSDGLCRAATGSGFTRRTLYDDGAETMFGGARAIILNGIGATPTRSDLASRCWPVTLRPITDSERLADEDWRRRVEDLRPRVLGALLDALVVGLAGAASVPADTVHHRMVDAGRLLIAAAPALGLDPDDARAVLERARDQGRLDALEASPLGGAVLRLAAHVEKQDKWLVQNKRLTADGAWRGSASDLLADLGNMVASAGQERGQSWPRTPHHLTTQLRRLAPALRLEGVELEWGRGNASRWVEVRRCAASADRDAAGDAAA